MKQLLFAIAATFAAIQLHAQAVDSTKVDTWKLKGSAGLNMAQTSLTNWSAGGDNSFSGGAYLNGSLERKVGKWAWFNTLALEYGLTTSSDKGVQKSSDRIEFSTQLGYSNDDKWFYTAMADFKSQFYTGYSNSDKTQIVSKFLAPAYSNISLGMEYKPKDKFYSLYFSPTAGKLTFVQDNCLSSQGAFGVDKGDKFKAEFGTYFKVRAEKGIMENVKVVTDASFFTSYDKSFGNVDIDWNMLISMKINKYMNASINTTLKYDDDIKYIDSDNNKHGARIQFKEIIGVGFGYNF